MTGFRAAAALVLAEHHSFTVNASGTRIRCNATACATVLDIPDTGAVTAFASHQAGLLPEPEPAAVPVTASAPEPAPAPSAAPDPFGDTVDTVDTAITETVDLTPAETVTGTADTAPGKPSAPDEAVVKPAEEPASKPAAPAAKTRRDTKALTATIEQIKKGDRVSAVLNHPRYGQFTVEGTILKGGAGQDRDQLIVGGWYLNTGARAAKHLQELTIIAPAGQHGFEIPKPSEATEHIGIGG